MTAAVGWLSDTLVRENEGKEPRGALYDEVSTCPSRLIDVSLRERLLIETELDRMGKQEGKQD